MNQKSDHKEPIGSSDNETKLKSRVSTQVKRPSLYKVVMLNDDYTPMEFVVHIMKTYFKKSEPEAIKLMLQIHNIGYAVVGVFTREIAESKTHQVNEVSKKHEYPLLTRFEKE